MRTSYVRLAVPLLVGWGAPVHAQQPNDSAVAILGRVAEAMVRAAPEVSRVWPGYWPVEQGILLLREDTAALLLSPRKPPLEYSPVPPGAFSQVLRDRAFLRSSYPVEFTKGRFDLAHPLGRDTVPALPVRYSDIIQQLEFLYHETFHGYQALGGFATVPEDVRRARFGERLVDSEQVENPAFQAAAEAERRLLLAALDLPANDLLIAVLGQHLASRHARTGALADVRAVERRMERSEGTAEYVGCRAAAIATGRGDDAVRSCIRAELRGRLADFPQMPEADARWMRWRLYGTGAAIAYLLDHLDSVLDWQRRVERGAFLDELLRVAIESRHG